MFTYVYFTVQIRIQYDLESITIVVAVYTGRNLNTNINPVQDKIPTFSYLNIYGEPYFYILILLNRIN